jgi:hypothetical protein
MNRLFICTLIFCLCGCARINRYHADFYGTTELADFNDHNGHHETAILLHVAETKNVKVIGHDNLFLPLSNYVAILTTPRNHPFSDKFLSNNAPLCVNGILDNGFPITKGRLELFRTETSSNIFYAILKVKKIVAGESISHRQIPAN